MKRPVRREDQDTRPAFNLLRPFSIEDFPELAKRQGLTKRTPHPGQKTRLKARPYKDKIEQ